MRPTWSTKEFFGIQDYNHVEREKRGWEWGHRDRHRQTDRKIDRGENTVCR